VALSDAPLRARPALAAGGRTYTLGIGEGTSVREVSEPCREVPGHPIPAVIGARRPGDPAVLVASSDRIRAELGWRPRYELRQIVESAWAWRSAHPHGYADRAVAVGA